MVPAAPFVGDEIFIFGGTSGGSSIIYPRLQPHNPCNVTNTYRNLADMPGVRGFACCALVGDEIFIFGGRSSASNYSSTAIAYNPTTNTYRNLADMPGSRGYAYCALAGDEIFIFGGYDGSNYFNTAIAYNPSTNTYRNLA